MTGRYGERTRTTEPVANFGVRPSSGGGSSAVNVYEAEFLAPGTWTWPGNVSFVEVLVVGGGQGSGSAGSNSGGAGGVGIFQVPVSAPVPVTVGAGGTAPLGAGGTTFFGPSSPPLPNALARAGGGNTSGLYGGSHPGSPAFPTPTTPYGSFGTYAGPTNAPAATSGGANGLLGRTVDMGGMNKFGYGGGAPGFCGKGAEGRSAPLANTGNGACRTAPGGYAGGSGYVLVRWYEP